MIFNSNKFDFWKIYETIKSFYTISINGELTQLKELTDIIVDNIHDNEKFNSRWKDFTYEIENQIGKQVIGTTCGQAPSFSSYVLLDKVSLDNLIRTKELHFFVSLVGPFYTIIGQDNAHVIIEDSEYRSTSYLVVSPENEFAEVFQLLSNEIEKRFKGYRFIPFDIYKQSLKDIKIEYTNDSHNVVFHALFNDFIDLTISGRIGNESYKSEEWVRVGYKDQDFGWTIYPPKE